MPGIRPRAVAQKDQTKICTTCKQEKSLNQFYKYHRGKFGHMAHCKKCQEIKQHKLYADNPHLKKKRLEKEYERIRKIKYGITNQEYKQKLVDQGFCCLICHIKLDKNAPINVPHIDHDHSTGHVRGILCTRCNVGLGSFRDNIDYLYSAIAYLRKSHDINN